VAPVQCEGSSPVTLLSFAAKWAGESVVLEWETGSETDHMGFYVYRRILGGSWERITDRLVIGGPAYTYADPTATPGTRYQYEIESLSRTGETERFGPVEIQIPSAAGVTLRAVPNPFPGATTIHYTLSAPGPVRVQVFGLSGRLVRTLVDVSLRTGAHELVWDGQDDSGRPVASGSYFVELHTETGIRVLRVVLTR